MEYAWLELAESAAILVVGLYLANVTVGLGIEYAKEYVHNRGKPGQYYFDFNEEGEIKKIKKRPIQNERQYW